jgi:hypothetical protein
MRRVRAFALTALLVAGCQDAGSGTLALSWQFADGRSCTDAGALGVRVVASSQLGDFRCTDGAAPSMVSVDNVPRDGHLSIRAESPQSVELYRAELDTDDALLPTTVTLFATGVR